VTELPPLRSPLDERVAVVTGGASGIGRATVERFLADGACVVVGDLNVDAGERLVAEADGRDRLRFLRTDVAEEADVEALVEAAVAAFGRLDVVFNNAGIGGAFGPVTEIDVEHWDRTFAVLARSVFLGVKHGARRLIAQGEGGSIINTASIAGLVGGGGPLAYSAAKAAVVNLTLNAATELAPHRIRVNAICPGVIFTPLAVGRNEESLARTVEDVQPWPDHGTGADIAGVAAWLAGDDARFVTGEAIRVDGGLVAAGARMLRGVDPRGSWQRYAGFAPGTTGQAIEKRTLPDPPL
jgi:NAD(P)-dependent dehydrogenase (short-subunit alcohol dehydrogenase family)